MSLLPYRIFLLLSLILVLISASTDAQVTDLGNENSDNVKELRDDTFDAYVFPTKPRPQPQAWFILFYAPWCAHCKSVLPLFGNASRLLEKGNMPHAMFATVNAVKNRALASRFTIETYPTFLYTTGKSKYWHKFHGGHNIDSFVQFALYLQRGVMAGSFADDVSDPKYFLDVEQQMASVRVPMFVYVPATGEKGSGNDKQPKLQQGERMRDAKWNLAIDALASVGNIRFGVVYGDRVPDNWAEQGGSSYVAVINAARRCKGRGPDGEVLIVNSDVYKQPQCYEGPWFEDAENTSNDEKNRKGEGDNGNGAVARLHPSFTAYVASNGFRAVEEATPGLFSVLSGENHHYMGLLLTDGPVTQADKNMLPVLREIVQKRHETRAASTEAKPRRRISLSYADIRIHTVWLTRYHIGTEEIPAFLVVDPRRDKLYRLSRHTQRFEEIKSMLPWLPGGEQQEIIMAFLNDVENGRAQGEKLSIVGDAAEFLLRLPGMEFVYETLGYEDGLFITMVCGLTFFVFLLTIALVAEPLMEWRMAAKQKKD